VKYYPHLFRIILVFFLIFGVLYSIQLISVKNSPSLCVLDKGSEINPQATDQIPDFWNLTQIQNIPLNISIVKTYPLWDSIYSKNYTIRELYYTSQIWINNTPLRIFGELIIPDNRTGQLGRVPGVLLMHGLGGNHTQQLDKGYFLAAQNFSVLLIDFPGHGNSSGPPPSQQWLVPDLSGFDGNITADLLNRTHFYLSARAAVRAIDVLLNQTFIDPDRIVLTGGSYGGMNTIFASNIYWQKVRTAIPEIAPGDFNLIFSTSYSLFHVLINSHEIDMMEPPYSTVFHYLDPILYVNTTNNPSTLFICGTNDDFSPLEAFNNTLSATYNTTKAIETSPGGHHGILLKPSEGTILYWLNYTLWDGPAPPDIQVGRIVDSTLTGQVLEVTANVNCDAPISKVLLAYHWEVTGAQWVTQEMTLNGEASWTCKIAHLPFSADITYYVMVEINGTYYTMFSSYIWRSSLTTWLGIPFFILIGFGIALAVLFLFRRDLNKTKQQIPPENRRKLSYLYLVQIGGLGLTEIGILISLYLPIVVVLPQTNSLEITMVTFLDQFIDFLPYGTILIFGILLLGFILSLTRPTLGGVINFSLPFSIILIESVVSSILFSLFGENSGLNLVGSFMSIGSGVIIWGTLCIIQICFGIFKRLYKKRLLFVAPPS
jgi:cephalosporin-C deacetylase-like acetyl esterase